MSTATALSPDEGSPATPLSTLVEAILELEEIDPLLYRAATLKTSMTFARIYGGQVLGQALLAGTKTVKEGFNVHSLHAYFLRPGDVKVPVLYDVNPIRTGRSFATRVVTARQKGVPIFVMAASYQKNEVPPQLEHQSTMPSGIPPPESLPSMRELFVRYSTDERVPEPAREYFKKNSSLPWPFDTRWVTRKDLFTPGKLPARQYLWFRANGTLKDVPHLHEAVLLYMSDSSFLEASSLHHGVPFVQGKLQAASIDHTIFFHTPDVRADEWLLYEVETTFAGNARGLVIGKVYTREGRLVASTTQEGLIRTRRPRM